MPTRNTFRLLQTTAAISVIVVLVACAAQPTASPYPSAGYPSQNTVPSYSVLGQVRNVEVLRTPEQGRGSGVGAVLGGVAGAVVGRQIGGGSGRDAATVAGVVGGALAGNTIEKNRNAGVRESYRISIQLDNGAARIFEVPSPGELRIGDRVRIENGQISRM